MIATDFVTQTVSILKDKSLRSRYSDQSYPANVVPFYLYGTPNSLNLDHILVRNPNIQLSAENVQLSISKGGSGSAKGEDHSLFGSGGVSAKKVGDFFGLGQSSGQHGHHDRHDHYDQHDQHDQRDRYGQHDRNGQHDRYDQRDQQDRKSKDTSSDHGSIPAEALAKGAILVIEGISEAAMQPFQSTEGPLGDTLGTDSNFFFRPGQEFDVTVYEDGKAFDAPGPGLADVSASKKLGKGRLKLGQARYVDSVAINKDPFEQIDGVERYKAWKAKLDLIGKELVWIRHKNGRRGEHKTNWSEDRALKEYLGPNTFWWFTNDEAS